MSNVRWTCVSDELVATYKMSHALCSVFLDGSPTPHFIKEWSLRIRCVMAVGRAERCTSIPWRFLDGFTLFCVVARPRTSYLILWMKPLDSFVAKPDLVGMVVLKMCHKWVKSLFFDLCKQTNEMPNCSNDCVRELLPLKNKTRTIS